MKNKYMVILLLVVLGFFAGLAVAVCTSFSQNRLSNAGVELYVNGNEETKPAFLGREGLYVNGVEIEANLVYLVREDMEYVELPLIAILDTLGYPVTWLDETRAEIEINGTLFIAKLETVELVEKEHEYELMANYIHAVPGNPWGYVLARDGDIYVDQYILKYSIFTDLQIPATVSVKFEQQRVDVRLNSTK